MVRDGEVLGVPWKFNGWGEKFPPWDDDARVAGRILELAGVRTLRDVVRDDEAWGDVVMEGGAFDSDGEGTLLTTASVLLNSNRNPSMGREAIEACLRQRLGIQRIVWLPHGLLCDADTVSTLRACRNPPHPFRIAHPLTLLPTFPKIAPRLPVPSRTFPFPFLFPFARCIQLGCYRMGTSTTSLGSCVRVSSS